MIVTKTHKIIFGFLLYAVLFYFFMTSIVRCMVDNHITINTGVIESMLIQIFYFVTGLYIYIAVINLTAIIGLILATVRKDENSVKAFKMLTIFAIGLTLIYFLLVNFSQ